MPVDAQTPVTDYGMTNAPGEQPRNADFVQKEVRCRLAGCPYADRSGEKGSPCEECSGPVVWNDEKGNKHGRCRSCTGCPMNGKGLPVCWAACPGPNPDFTTDGEDIVTLGSMDNPDSYVASYSHKDGACGECPVEVERMMDSIDGTDPDNESEGTRWGFSGFSTESEETRAARIAERLLSLDGSTVEMLMKLHKRNIVTVTGITKNGRSVSEVFSHIAEARAWARVNCRPSQYSIAEDRRTVAERIGCDIHSVTDEDGIVSRIFKRLEGRNAGDWDSLRSKAMGMKQTTAARLMLVTKQAVSKRDKKMALSGGVSIADGSQIRHRVSTHHKYS